MRKHQDNESGVTVDRTIKLLVIGESGVGKTCLAQQFAQDFYQSNFITTIGVDFQQRTVQINRQMIRLQIWDTAGQERFRAITTSYFRNAHGVLLVYDITKRSSFNQIRSWIRELELKGDVNLCVALIGNKADLEGDREVTYDQGKELALELNIPYFDETSAKDDLNVDTIFIQCANIVLQRMELKRGGMTTTMTIELDHNNNRSSSRFNKGCCNR